MEEGGKQDDECGSGSDWVWMKTRDRWAGGWVGGWG